MHPETYIRMMGYNMIRGREAHGPDRTGPGQPESLTQIGLEYLGLALA